MGALLLRALPIRVGRCCSECWRESHPVKQYGRRKGDCDGSGYQHGMAQRPAICDPANNPGRGGVAERVDDKNVRSNGGTANGSTDGIDHGSIER